MKRTLLASVIAACGSAVLITVVLLLNPVVALAATCTAHCTDGSVVTISNVYSCVSEDGVGITYHKVAGGETLLKSCPIN